MEHYNRAARRMHEEVERQLGLYRQHKQEIQAYRQSALNGTRAAQGEYVRGSLPGDPTAIGALKLLEPDAPILQKAAWVEIIDKARYEMRHFAPELARILTVCYGLDKKRAGGARMDPGTRYRLMEELSISQTTLYNRRIACVEWVKALALYRGLLCPEMKEK